MLVGKVIGTEAHELIVFAAVCLANSARFPRKKPMRDRGIGANSSTIQTYTRRRVNDMGTLFAVPMSTRHRAIQRPTLWTNRHSVAVNATVRASCTGYMEVADGTRFFALIVC